MVIGRLAAFNGPQGDQFAEQLCQLIPCLLSTKAAKDFTLAEVIEEFNLNYNTVASLDDVVVLERIEDSKLDFTKMTPCFGQLFSTTTH